MIGPSICVMCRMEEETTKHLLQGCEWVRQVWEEGGRRFSKARWGKGPIADTIEQWDDKAFKNAIVSRLWILLPGFIVWSMWKERNHRVFERRRKSPIEI